MADYLEPGTHRFKRFTCPDCGSTWKAFPDSSDAADCFMCEVNGRPPTPPYRGKEKASEKGRRLHPSVKSKPTNQQRGLFDMSTTEKETRNQVGHVVEKGQAGSKKKAQAAREKVEANAERVREMNEASAEAEAKTDDAKREVTPRFKEGKAPAKKAPAKRAPAKKAPAKKATATAKKATAKRTKPKEGRNVGKAIDASTKEGYVDRLNAASKEIKALDDWWKAGGKGQPPATPNLIAANADHAAGKKPTKRGGKRAAARVESDNKRLNEARDLKAAGKRAKGEVQVLDDKQLQAWCVKELRADPTLTKAQARMIAFRVDRIALSNPRFFAAFEAAQKQLKKKAS